MELFDNNKGYKMITISKKSECCGCGACENICPKNLITMKADSEGFLYPEVDRSRCIDCGQCEAVCPVMNHDSTLKTKNRVYGAQNIDENIRRQSSSGGIFYLLAEKHLENGGVVAGAAFNESFVLHHQFASDINEVDKLLGSKYVQSKTGDIYKKVRNYLDSGIPVLFSGTSCQVEALKSFLRKPYNNLTTVDIICHGVPSPLLWEKYKKWISAKFKDQEIQGAFFRDKSSGWKKFSITVKFKNKSQYSKRAVDDAFMRAFLKNYCLRPSCYSCSFKGVDRISDITLGDFWGVAKVVPELDDNKGTSLIITHSDRGEEAFRQIRDCLKIVPVDSADALKSNTAALYSCKLPPCRTAFMQDLQANDFDFVYHKYLEDSMAVKIRKAVKNLFRNGIGFR